MLGARVQREAILDLQQPPQAPAGEVGAGGQGDVSELRGRVYADDGEERALATRQVQEEERCQLRDRRQHQQKPRGHSALDPKGSLDLHDTIILVARGNTPAAKNRIFFFHFSCFLFRAFVQIFSMAIFKPQGCLSLPGENCIYSAWGSTARWGFISWKEREIPQRMGERVVRFQRLYHSVATGHWEQERIG
jgi:hypothetical protein